RISRPRIIAHRVNIGHPVPITRAIGRPGAFTQAVVGFVGKPLQVVIHAVVPPSEVVSLSRTIHRGDLPFVVRSNFPFAAESYQRDRQANVVYCDSQFDRAFLKRDLRQIITGQVETIASLEWHIFQARRDHPGSRMAQLAERKHHHADNVPIDRGNMRDVSLSALQSQPSTIASLYSEDWDGS